MQLTDSSLRGASAGREALASQRCAASTALRKVLVEFQGRNLQIIDRRELEGLRIRLERIPQVVQADVRGRLLLQSLNNETDRRNGRAATMYSAVKP